LVSGAALGGATGAAASVVSTVPAPAATGEACCNIEMTSKRFEQADRSQMTLPGPSML